MCDSNTIITYIIAAMALVIVVFPVLAAFTVLLIKASKSHN
jgi:hypothetical protein